MIDLIDVNVPKQHKGESRPLTRYELDMIRQEHLEKDRAKMKQKMMHENKVKAAKKAVKEFLVCSGIGIALGLALLYAIASDPYEPPKKEVRVIRAAGSNYYYPEDEYEQCLKEKAAYEEEEKNKESGLLQSGTEY